MDARVQKAIQQTIALRKDPVSVPWKPDEPWRQSHYTWDEEEEAWKPASTTPNNNSNSSSSSSSRTQSSEVARIRSIVLYSWNIDFMLPYAESRMETALSHLAGLIAQLPPSPSATAVVIFLQECTPSDLGTISRQPWVRSRFHVTDLDASGWGNAGYGTTTLVDRALNIQSCFRVHYSQSKMERDALFVDVALPQPLPQSTAAEDSSSSSGSKKPPLLRLCNTHLESLVPVPALRPAQMQLVSTYMKRTAPEEEVSSAIVAGDFNAIQPEDRTLHDANGLRDAYLELGGAEDSETGYTWGQQALRALREQFGCSRMDKVYFCNNDSSSSSSGSGGAGGSGLELQSFERIGADVEVEEGKDGQRSGLLALGFEKAWVTDHLGVKAVFNLK
ncbi:endonuclease/exonuclease/phosphatase family protein [Xylaria arbuscula]|nr:endonuclease/exonuclease/phosphatase family protein [Xylaria arbuscula]